MSAVVIPTNTEESVKLFLQLVEKGIASWVLAGELLVSCVKEDPSFLEDVLAANAGISRGVLEAFIQIGRKQIYPQLILDPSRGAKRLAGLPYAVQERVYHEGVHVVIRRGEKFYTENKRVSQLEQSEIAQVFDGIRIRNEEEQKTILTPVKKPTAWPKNDPAPVSAKEMKKCLEEFVAPPSVKVRTDDPTKIAISTNQVYEQMEKCLNEAQSNVTMVRELLMRIGKGQDDKLDQYLTVALQCISRLKLEGLNKGV